MMTKHPTFTPAAFGPGDVVVPRYWPDANGPVPRYIIGTHHFVALDEGCKRYPMESIAACFPLTEYRRATPFDLRGRGWEEVDHAG